VSSSGTKKLTSISAIRRDAAELAPKQLITAYRQMLLARLIDEKAIILYKQNKAHFQIGCAGHEAVQVAAAHCMKPGFDWFYPYYRDMALCTALGMTTREHLLGILNKAADPNSGGRQMPMHYGHKDLNIVTQSSPTGTQYLQAVGAAQALEFRGENEVVYVSSGEGTTAQGAYHEALNWAARKKLPIIFMIQNNKYAISVHISEQLAGGVSDISQGYQGLNIVKVNGLDYVECFYVISEAIARARRGEGPTVIEAETVRLQSHSISDNQAKYRPAEELAKDKERDPIKLFAAHLLSEKILTEDDLSSIQKELQAEVDAAATWAESQPDPAPNTFADHVVITPDPGAGVTEKDVNGPEMFIVDALNKALDEELSRNDEMVVFGEDIAGDKGGVFTVTSGLTNKYGKKRVFNSPLAEESIIGTGIGMATLGMKPVVEIQFGDYVWTGVMQIWNELSKIHYRSNGAFNCPMVVRIPVGGYIHGGLYHSQNIEATFAHLPGVNVIYPSNARDAKGLLKAAIRSNNPTLFLEHKGLYRQIYAKASVGGIDDLTPIGRAKILRIGGAATIVTWGAMVYKSLLAADALAKEGLDVEVIDIRTVLPLDTETILSSVKKTGRLLIAHEDCRFMGFGAEIAAIAAESVFEFLDAPVMRIAGKDTPIPHASSLEDMVLPQNKDVEEALRKLLAY